MEFFGGEVLISTKFFRGRPIFLRGATHVLWKSSGVNRMQLKGEKKRYVLNLNQGDTDIKSANPFYLTDSVQFGQ